MNTLKNVLPPGLYQPVSQEKILTEMFAVGRTAVWRLLTGYFTSMKENVITKMSEEDWTTPLELENFMLTELNIG